MKLLVVSGSDDTYKHLSVYVNPLGFELIHYRHILKAMDNIDEIDPNAIILSARDFPRHWKTMVQFVRNERPKDACPIIILKGENFPVEEASKASYLGVSGIVAENLENAAEIDRLQGILSRYMPTDEKRRAQRYHTETWQRFGFAFTRPLDSILVTGEVKDVSSGGFSFMPDVPDLMQDINLNMELGECSFRAGDDILAPRCRLARTGPTVCLEFLSFPDGERETLDTYMESLPLLERRNTEKNREAALAAG